jgi:hypothetical protein
MYTLRTENDGFFLYICKGDGSEFDLTSESAVGVVIEEINGLLQALEAICEHANEAWAALDHDYHEVLAGNLGDAVDQARAVIAKAKGQAE